MTRHKVVIVGSGFGGLAAVQALEGADVDVTLIDRRTGTFLALLPSFGQIVAKFDFYDAQLSWTQPGADPLTYKKQSVTLIRPPTEDAN